MEDLLFLVHRIPFPPNKGDKVRSYHLLEYLRRRYRVHLGTFIDHPEDRKYVKDVRELCEQVYVSELDPRTARLRSLTGLLSGEPLTVRYYRSRPMQEWVDGQVAKHSIDRILVFSSAMAQYAERHARSGCRCVIDFVDVDSDKWRQYAEKRSWPTGWLYRRESRTLLAYERTVSRLFDASVFATEEEVALFERLAPHASGRATCVKNGVDTDYFSPDLKLESPFPGDIEALVFTGAMDYWPNADAVCWFAQAVFPKILKRCPNTRFYIVGARPTQAVRALGHRPGITVTGTVNDVRPYIAHASACVAPLRIARGVQNKVLEALAMARPLLATSPAMKGIEPTKSITKFVADDPDKLAELAIQLLNGTRSSQETAAARAWVMENFNWNKNLKPLSTLLEQEHHPKPHNTADLAPANP